MKVDIRKLTVTYNQRIVGYLAEIEKGRIAFQYDDEWVSKGFSISPFSLPLSNQVHISKSGHFGGLFGVFGDSLPDGWGELLVRRMLAGRGVSFEASSPLFRLALIGWNGLGALAYEPTKSFLKRDDLVDLDELALEVKRILGGTYRDSDLDHLYHAGGSSGGANPKAHVRMDDSDWIVKFPASIDPIDIGKSEYETNLLAQKSGIDVSSFSLFPSKTNSGYFGTRRFDRLRDRRIHMISLSGILETTHRIPNLDYMHLFQVIQKISVDQNDLYEAYRRMCFNVLFENKDDHGKNHAFLYDEGACGYRLSPAFDLIRTPNKAEHEMTVVGEGKPTESDLIRMISEMKLSKKRCMQILHEVKEAKIWSEK